LSALPRSEPLLRLRPLGLGEVVDDIFRVYRRHFWLIVGIALLLALPGLLVQFASGSAQTVGFVLGLLPDLGNPAALAARQPPPPPNLGLLALSYLVAILTFPFTLGALTQAALDLVQGNPVSIRASFRGVLRRYWALMGLAALFVLLSPTALCLPVFVWLIVRWVVAIPALLAEGLGPIRALDRSWTLTRDSWWRLAAILVVAVLLEWVVSGTLGALGYPVAIVIPFIPEVVRGAIVLTLETVAGALVQPVLYLCIVLLYFDLRIRREDFDLDQLARQAVGPRG
jgi:membrane-anchored glycerophosphoryl diester phosphodiesterase (GDPDase)